jgi:DNA polymerase-3 subunit gamma/tau
MKGDFSKIEKILENPNHNHVFLFTGGAGRGKTTMSRILAQKVGANELDIREINCSNTNGIDDIRAIIDDMPFAPNGLAKVYILDEFHKVTPAAQNCLLKELEDTPEHVYFILCSSEPTKIIPALRSRPICIDFPPLSVDQLYGILKGIKSEEKFNVSRDMLFSIAERANGSAREAINILEKIGSLEPEEQSREVEKGTETEDAEILDLCRLYFQAGVTWKEMRKCLGALKEKGIEPEAIRRSLLGYGQAILLREGDDNTAFRMDKLMYNSYDSGYPGLVTQLYLAWASATRGF